MQVFGDDMDALECAGKLALYSAMIMMSLDRLPESLATAVNACRFFSKIFEHELEFDSIRNRKLNPVLRLKGAPSLGQALRLTGEIKMHLGATKSAKKDLDL